jgi:hypothetical protein
MGVKYYGRGEHPAGYIGFRVTVAFGSEAKQSYFKTGDCGFQDDRDIEYKKRRLRAEIQDADWRAESALYSYRKFVSEDHHSTRSGRGLGFQGMTKLFTLDRRGQYQAGLTIHFSNTSEADQTAKSNRLVTFRSKPFSEAWEHAVNIWAEVHGVLDVDRERILANPPNPSSFSELRRTMNSEGFDIPVEALEPVFREQRESLKRARQQQSAKQINLAEGAPTELDDSLQKGMTEWFQSQTSEA